MSNDYHPIAKTARFDIFHQHVTRNPDLGVGRDMYTAWYREYDVPRPVCVVTLFGHYVEWIEVSATHRRQGIATEVLAGLEAVIGGVMLDAATDEGEAWVAAMESSA